VGFRCDSMAATITQEDGNDGPKKGGKDYFSYYQVTDIVSSGGGGKGCVAGGGAGLGGLSINVHVGYGLVSPGGSSGSSFAEMSFLWGVST